MRKPFSFHLLVMLCMILLCSCTAEPTEYRKNIPKFEMEDRDTKDAVYVSSVISYERTAVDAPEYADYMHIQKYIYTDGDSLYVPFRYETPDDPIRPFAAAIVRYDSTGVILDMYPVPGDSLSTIAFRVLSDGRFLLWKNNTGKGASGIRLEIMDADGTVLHTVNLPPFSEAVENFAAQDWHGLHVTEQPDGTMRIFVNLLDRAYYFDEALTLIGELELPTECTSIHRESDGVYIIGNQLPSICRVDMNNLTVTAIKGEDLPVLPEMKYFCEILFGANGAMYCRYEDAVYRCPWDAETEMLTQIMAWEQGMCTGEGYIWILNDTCIYYLPYTTGVFPPQLYRLEPGVPLDTLERRLLTLVSLSPAREWMTEAVRTFNEENDSYFIKLIDLSTVKDGKNSSEQFNEYLLENEIPDIVIFNSKFSVDTYSDEKDLLLDLTPYYGEQLLGCVKTAFSENSGAQYSIPLTMQLEFYASAVQKTPLSWEEMYAQGEMLDSGEKRGALISSSPHLLIHRVLRDFYDLDAKTASFDSSEFVRRWQFLERLEQENGSYYVKDYGAFLASGNNYDDYGIYNGTRIGEAICSGEVSYLNVPLHTIQAFPALKFLFGDTPYYFCGYPTEAGAAPGAFLYTSALVSVFAELQNLGGCQAFLDFILSDTIQTSPYLTSIALPVTRSAMEQLLDENRYHYIAPTAYSSSYLIEPTVSSPTPKSMSDYYTCVEITDADRDMLMQFFETCAAYVNHDLPVYNIVMEEISAYESGIRTLEEAAKLIQSRVWIYVNE